MSECTESIIGKIIKERYYIESIIHESSMSVVYRAIDITNNTYVVIKQCNHTDISGIDLLYNEYNILRNISHKGLPSVNEYIREEASDYIVMEFINGITLEYILYNYELSEYHIITIISELCRILIYLHNNKPPVYHCDIKPSNIIISNEHNVYLVDYGVSVCNGRNNGKSYGSCFGTQGYASPEQFESYEYVDARADIYSLGVLIYNIIDVNKKNDGLSELKNIAKRCTSRNKYYRYSDVSEILTEIMLITGEQGTVKLLYVP